MEEKDWFIGDEVQKKWGQLNLQQPISRATITNWDNVEKVGCCFFGGGICSQGPPYPCPGRPCCLGTGEGLGTFTLLCNRHHRPASGLSTHHIVVPTTWFCSQSPGSESRLHYLLPTSFWTSNLASLALSFLICKKRYNFSYHLALL